MRILVFNGSPKIQKSDTMHITRAFLDGMNLTGKNEIILVNSAEKNVRPCTGCFSCMNGGGKCVQDDEMEKILPEFSAADVIVWSFPLYAYGMPSTLKAVVDRLLPLSQMTMRREGGRFVHESRGDFSRQKYVMICGCGFPNFTDNFEGMIFQFRAMFGDDSTIIAVPESPMFSAPQADSVTKPFLENVKKAGAEFTSEGKITEATMKKLRTPMLDEELYAKICNGEV